MGWREKDEVGFEKEKVVANLQPNHKSNLDMELHGEIICFRF